MAAQDESIRALATVTLDAGALEALGPRTMDRLADLVAERLAQRRALGDLPFLTAQEAGRVAGVHPETVRRAIRSGALPVAGYVGQRPRLRREDVNAWVAGGEAPGASVAVGPGGGVARARSVARPRRVLGDALRLVREEADR